MWAFLLALFFDVDKVNYFKSTIKDVEIEKFDAKHICKHYRDSVKFSPSLKLRGENLQNNEDHEKAMTCLFSRVNRTLRVWRQRI